MRYICTSIVATLALVGTSFAATINVPGDYTTIQAAVDAASNGDEILVAPGTYTGTGNEVVNTLGKAITLRASGTPEETIIDGEGQRRVVECSNGEGADTVIEGFTITDGSTTGNGGGIYCSTSSPTITNCTFENNTAYYGGGSVVLSGSPTLTGCTFENNSGDAVGGGSGGIQFSHSNATLTDCIFTNNWGSIAGGIHTVYSDITLENCTFTGNTSDVGGGMLNAASSPTLTNCTFENNTANYDGGGMLNNNSSPTLENCTFENNTANTDGGGMENENGSNPTLTGTTVCGNTPDQIHGDWIDNGGNYISELCDEDCNDNGTPDDWDIKTGLSEDCNANGVPDECDLAIFATATFTFGDAEFDDTDNETITLINTAGTSRTYVIRNDYEADGENALEFNAGASASVAADNFKLAVDSSTGHNGTITVVVEAGKVTMTQGTQGYAGNTTIAHSSGWDALCDVNPPSAFSGGTNGDVDCNANGVPDSCDFADGGDANGDGVLDECECHADVAGPDGTGFPNGIVGIDDLLTVIGFWGSSIPEADVNNDGIVNIEDLLLVISAWGPCP